MYALVITIAAGVLLLALLAGVALLARRIAGGDGLGSVRGWRWYPSPLGLLLVLPVAAFLVLRLAPALLLIPVLLPVLWRRRWLMRPLLFVWNLGRSARPPEPDDDGPIEGRYRPL